MQGFLYLNLYTASKKLFKGSQKLLIILNYTLSQVFNRMLSLKKTKKPQKHTGRFNKILF